MGNPVMTTLMVASSRLVLLLLESVNEQMDNCTDNRKKKQAMGRELIESGLLESVYIVISHISCKLVEKGLNILY